MHKPVRHTDGFWFDPIMDFVGELPDDLSEDEKSQKWEYFVNIYNLIMQIETKYNIGDEVWTIHNNHIYQGVINKIAVNVCKEVNITYTVRVKNQTGSWTIDRAERRLFDSKEELLKSL